MMIDQTIDRVRVDGVLSEQKVGFARYLESLGYARLTIANQIRVMACLSRWLAEHDVDLADFDDEQIQAFLVFRREHYSSVRSVNGLARLLEYLRGVGLVAERVVAQPVSPAEVVVAEYATYLTTERGLAATTIGKRCDAARLVLTELADDGVDLAGLDGQWVVDFVQDHVGDHGIGSAKLLVSGLRCLLRFFYLSGRTPRLLADVVPGVADSRRRQLPKHIDAGVVEGLIDSCADDTVVGLRDRAVLLLLARLGLRCGEVAGLRFDDLDWRGGLLRVRATKSPRGDMLPLPADVGAAIATYLHQGRPSVEDRRVFLRVIAPVTGLSSETISDIVRLACVRAGVPSVSGHQLRHTLATETLNAGASLVEVSQLLRHSELATTSIYAKVDYARLAMVAAVWPGGGR